MRSLTLGFSVMMGVLSLVAAQTTAQESSSTLDEIFLPAKSRQAPARMPGPPQASQSNARDPLAHDALKPIDQARINIRPSAGILPADPAAPRFRNTDLTSERVWPESLFMWEPPGLKHRPLYFEEPNLERYGYHHGVLQPVVSGAHFYSRVIALPYLMTLDRPYHSQYALGHYRPGSVVPYHKHRIPFDAKAALVQAGVVTGLIFALP